MKIDLFITKDHNYRTHYRFLSTNNTITQEIPINVIISKNECIKLRLFKKISNQFEEVAFVNPLVSLLLGMSIFKQPQFQNGIQPSNKSPDYLKFKTKIENGIILTLTLKKHLFCKNCIVVKKLIQIFTV